MELLKDNPKLGANSSTEKLNLQKEQAFIDKYIEQIKSIATLHLSGKEGDVDGVKFKNVFNAGKQQASPIMNLSFPEGVSFEAVFRPTHRQFAEFYENYDVVKKYFPHLFAKIDTTKINSPSTVLVLERINGYDSKFKNDEAPLTVCATRKIRFKSSKSPGFVSNSTRS